ncbi:MAG TPA: response regulator [Candidatus Angelobacter sp.]|nr:response regulator [Candidatus Angelobacter sp.]
MKPLTVLVAEDDLLTRMVLERSVVQWGYQLVSAVDGDRALEVLRSRSVDVCVLDWDMPGVTGVDICRWLRTNSTAATPYIVLVTSRDKPAEIQTGYEAGADDYLTKPCDLKYLRRRIATVAEKTRRQEQWLEQANSESTERTGIAGLSPLDIYLSDLRLMRRKT